MKDHHSPNSLVNFSPSDQGEGGMMMLLVRGPVSFIPGGTSGANMTSGWTVWVSVAIVFVCSSVTRAIPPTLVLDE